MKNPIIPVFAGLLGFFFLWFVIAAGPEDFEGNLLPELIGFCLEGIFFVGIFSWMQERKDKDRKRELRQSLAGAVGFFCQLINGCLDEADQVQLIGTDNWSRQARTNGRNLKELEKKIKAVEIEITNDQVQAIKQLLSTRLSTLDSLLSVSAQLSHSHLSAYNMILTEIHKIATHHYFGDSQELKRSFVSLLRLLISFNNEEL
jgi:hypothetical protein